MFWFNPSETFIDVFEPPAGWSGHGRRTHWVSESGLVDFFLLPGPTPAAVYDQFTRLVGRQQLPPLFALGYHQCRWNYRDQKDVAAVEGMFESLDFPVDVIWLVSPGSRLVVFGPSISRDADVACVFLLRWAFRTSSTRTASVTSPGTTRCSPRLWRCRRACRATGARW